MLVGLALAVAAGVALAAPSGSDVEDGGRSAGCERATGLGGGWPAACWRPFDAASPFNTPLPARPRIAPRSREIVRALLRHSDRPLDIEAHEDGRGGEPTYWSTRADPLFRISCTRGWGRCPLEGSRIRIPAGARPEGGRGSDVEDAHMTIVDRRRGRIYELWQVRRDELPATGGRLRVSWAGITSLHGSGADGLGSATAARFSSLAGRVRAEEMAAGRVDHALFVVLPCDNGRYVYPARKSGARCRGWSGAPPMGARLQLGYSDAEIAALRVPAWKRTLLRAMARYGMFFGDTGTPGLFTLERETGLQYTVAGRRDRWLDFARSNGFWRWEGDGDGAVYIGDLASGVDWSRLRVIAPCVSRGRC